MEGRLPAPNVTYSIVALQLCPGAGLVCVQVPLARQGLAAECSKWLMGLGGDVCVQVGLEEIHVSRSDLPQPVFLHVPHR